MAFRPIRAALSMLVFACAAAAASATVTEYTDPTAFGAAVGSTTTFNFDGLSAPGTFTLGDVSEDGLSFSTSSSNLPVIWGSGALYNGSTFFSSVSPAPGVDAAQLLCTLSGANAIGFIYGDFADGGAIPFTVTLSTGDTFTLDTPTLAGIGTGFVGFVSNTPITSVTFSDDGQAFDVLQVERSSGSTVGAPEPGPLALLAAGLLALAVCVRARTLAAPARRTAAR